MTGWPRATTAVAAQNNAKLCKHVSKRRILSGNKHLEGGDSRSNSGFDWGRSVRQKMIAASLGIGLLMGPGVEASSSLELFDGQNCDSGAMCQERANPKKPTNPYGLEFPPLPDLQLPKYEQFVLKNGMKVFLLEDKEVPTVRGKIIMKGGGYMDPDDKVGLAQISAAAQKGGGSVSHPGTEIDDRLDELSAVINGGSSPLAISMGFECLKEDTPEVLNLFADVIRNPGIPEDKVALYRSQLLEGIKHRNDSNALVARRTLEEVIYGPTSIYARRPTKAQVSKLGRDEVVDFLKSRERPDAAVLGIVGDFSTPAMKKLITENFGDWRPAPGEPSEPLDVPKSDIPNQFHRGWVFMVQDATAKQASVAIAEIGVSLTDENVASLDVLSGLFNSYGGRLFDEIRSKGGLAYSVSGGWETPTDHPGLFILQGSTTMPVEFVKKATQELKRATVEAPSQSEVEKAKAGAINSFVFNFASTGAQLNRSMTFDILGLPQDYLFQYKSRVEGVTTEDVLQAAAKHLHPGNQVMVVAGDVVQFRKGFEDLGFHVVLYEPV
ncbi:hypothetical protein BSKO_10040 [Bryopsis sp. KO-2023]|nr:hypothetical protein BSKO_10040 [Bryopsis sp. KO-2023]